MGGDDKLSVPSVSPTRKLSIELTDLKKQRGNLKGRLTQFRKYLDSFQISSASGHKIKEIRFRMKAAMDLYKNFNDIESQIELLSPESEVVNNSEYVESFELLYFDIMATSEGIIECSETGDNTNTSNSSHISRAQVKLPDIRLPSFDGLSFDTWLEYKNSYVTMIHERSDLNDIQKFHYLKSSLSNSALQVISALEFTSNNYKHAWDLLQSRYHNPRLLVHNHLKSLFSIPPLKQESHTQIRKLIDTVLRNLRALNSLDEPTDSWDTIIIYLIVTKLDTSTERDWERHKGTLLCDSSRKLKLEDLLSFLRGKADMLDMISSSHSKVQSRSMVNINENKNTQHKNNVQSVHSFVSTAFKGKSSNSNHNKRLSCPLCNGNHQLYSCFQFLNLSIQDRMKLVSEKQLCNNCLRPGHSNTECLFGPCKSCARKHNTLLHLKTNNNNDVSMHNECTPTEHHNNMTNVSQSIKSGIPSGQGSVNAGSSTALHSMSIDSYHAVNRISNENSLQTVLLCTALVEIVDHDFKRVHTARALLDSGSQHSFISDNLRKRINASCIQSTLRISGVAQSVSHCNQSCHIIIRSKLSDYTKKVQCFVLQRITSSLPTTSIDTDHIRIPNNIQLADPAFHSSSEIELLIGADLFWEILDDNRIRLVNGPFLQNSKFGWLISGPIYSKGLVSAPNEVQCNFTQSLDDQLKRFWEIENVPQSSHNTPLTRDEQTCEELFCKTTKRDAAGRFFVRIPLREPPESLGDSLTLARSRFFSLERKLERSPEYKRMYCQFMSEYETLGHMNRVDSVDYPNYFLPHHGVFRENSSTTKLRVVFNASAASSSDKSLNDIQLPGPALQNDIFSILIRFRQYKYVACADVEKMFRQVMIQSDQRTLQLILWRDKPIDPLKIYQLNTVTYGTASAPYLSMRCIRQLAFECKDDEIARVITEDIFVDDLITGHDNYQSLLEICEKTSKILESGRFLLRKWTFNSDVNCSAPDNLFVGEHTQNKTLGIGWHNDSDELYYATKIDYTLLTKLTKRVMLSTISQIYDPLGLLSPAVIISKILLQKLWLSKLDWDTPVSPEIVVTWNNFLATFNHLSDLKIPRHVIGDDPQHVELHVFTDASQSAYGACAYIRTYSDNSDVTVKLLCAKSKVAPLKSITIPRLELCGALVGAKLYKKVIESLRLTFNRVFFWTDSTIVISWVQMSPHLLKPFVQNRVTEINEFTNDSIWFHVASGDNPADLLSRGLNLDMLASCDLWWTGPPYLRNHHFNIQDHVKSFGNDKPYINVLPELRSQDASNFICVRSEVFVQFENYSSFNKLRRTRRTYVLRFLNNTRNRIHRSDKSIDQLDCLSVDELNASELILAKFAQMQSFPELYERLLSNLPIKSNGKEMNRISGLNVFLDAQNIIRVGGRLGNATTFDYDKKHPILLCNKHHFSMLLVRYNHKRLLHAGPQLLLAHIREKWWLLCARNLTRKIVRECIICTRMKGKTLTPIMGNLPSERLDSGFPFIRTGVDYAGPIMMLNRKGRGARLTKCYVALFVCFVTRAVHLELVTSLSTEDYILTLKRFISRRGKPNCIYSDNGKNFVGAAKEFSSFFVNKGKQLLEFAADEGIQFQFIPPYSPHFGGLWESGVRSCKHHLRRIVGNAKLTYEELSTILTQVESVLNSRPMSPLSSNPTDLNPLTPGHFLIGRPLTAPPVESLLDVSTSRLSRYHYIEQLRQQFWQRWSREYVSELQQRTKWKTQQKDIKLDALVILKDDNLPPLKWRLGRIKQVYPGADGVSRVADIYTAAGVTRRAFSKICPLPLQPEDN